MVTVISAWWLLWIGLALCALGGFGTHLLGHFSGLSLEGYCRLKRKRERYGEILDHQERSITGAKYLFLIGSVLLLSGGSLWLANRLGWFAEQGDVSRLHAPWLSFTGWLAGTAILLLLVSDWLPRVIVRYGATVIIFHTWPFWHALGWVMEPLATLGGFFHWLGYRLSDEVLDDSFDEEVLEDEIRTMVAAGEREGLVGKGIREMIQGVMNLDEGVVARIMTPRSQVDAIEINMPFGEMLQAISTSGRTRLPVYEGTLDNIIGIVFVKDILKEMAKSARGVPEIQPILRDAWRIPGNRRVNELLTDFLHKRNHMAIVVDEYQQTLGVVTIEDALEEIVGEIADEHEEEKAKEIVVNDVDGWVEAEGRVAVDQINKLVDWDLPESDDYDTIAGMVISQLNEIPAEGQEVQVGQTTIKVLKANQRQVRRVRLTHQELSKVAPP